MKFDFAFTPSRGPARSDAAAQGREAVAIVRAGGYTAPSGRRVDVSARVARAVAGTRDYPPEAPIGAPERPSVPRATRTSVVNGTTLAAARALAEAAADEPLVLNFASAKNPGGGFLGGARAQEESLARASALYACLETSAMYERHRALRDCMYTSYAIHSPHVPVFRDDATSALLEEPYDCAFLTAPAPNAGVVLERDPSRAAEVRDVMAARVDRVLAIAALHDHRRLVLGAWGCGVFRNDPVHVAECFRRALDGAFAGVFDEVVFAVLDTSEERRFVRPFAERFAD